MPLGITIDGLVSEVSLGDVAGWIPSRAMTMDLTRLINDESGATALEYGLMAAAVAGVLILVVYYLGGQISNALNNVAQHL
jgi:pilus assembly protein Flp/PilA